MDVRGGPGGGGGLNPPLIPNNLLVLTLLLLPVSSSPHRATDPRNPSPSSALNEDARVDVLG